MYGFFNRRVATAHIKGGADNPEIFGEVKFYQKSIGVLVVAHIVGLPKGNESGFFAFHIHEGDSCSGDEFSDTGGHYNPP